MLNKYPGNWQFKFPKQFLNVRYLCNLLFIINMETLASLVRIIRCKYLYYNEKLYFNIIYLHYYMAYKIKTNYLQNIRPSCRSRLAEINSYDKYYKCARSFTVLHINYELSFLTLYRHFNFNHRHSFGMVCLKGEKKGEFRFLAQIFFFFLSTNNNINLLINDTV